MRQGHPDLVLSKADAALIRALDKSDRIPVERRVLGWMSAAVGALLITAHIIAVLTGLSHKPLMGEPLLYGSFFLLVGIYRLMEYRYRKVIKYLLVNPHQTLADIKPTTDAVHPDITSFTSGADNIS